MAVYNRSRVEFPLHGDSPAFLESMYMQADGQGGVLIGLKKTSGADYAESLLSKDDLRRALAILTAGEGL